jgi:hypothetical protein
MHGAHTDQLAVQDDYSYWMSDMMEFRDASDRSPPDLEGGAGGAGGAGGSRRGALQGRQGRKGQKSMTS